MIKKLKNSILANIIIITVTFFLTIYLSISVLLPYITNHNETVIVPDLIGKSVEEASETLKSKKLRFKPMTKKGYSIIYPANAVLEQNPLPNSKVKPFRNVYIKLNSENPPSISCPNLLNTSIKNAQIMLKSHNLVLGEVTYIADIAQNAVLKQLYNGVEIKPGLMIPEGSKIDLVIGAGLSSNKSIRVPDLEGKSLEEARNTLISVGLQLGTVNKEVVDNVVGIVIKQLPKSGDYVKTGQMIDIWISTDM